MFSEYVLAEKYRPRSIDECILPNSLKKTFEGFIAAGKIPNLLLNGPPGAGKTTVAYILCDKLGYDVHFVNASLDRSMDVLRNEIMDFAATISFAERRKCVIMDEFDNASLALQNGLKAFIETFESNCSFIFTSNHKNKIIEAIHSRCAVIDFHIDNDERKNMVITTAKRIMYILSKETIPYNKDAIVPFIVKYFPDIRRMLNELQRFVAEHGEVNAGILTNKQSEKLLPLIKAMKDKDFKRMREWVGHNSDIDFDVFIRSFYDLLDEKMQAKSIPQAVIYLGEYSYKKAFVVDTEICLAAMLTLIMNDCEFL